MSILAAPIPHDIKDQTDWPEQFSEISHQLFRPFPQCVSSKALERRGFLSLGSWESYEEALDSSIFAVRDKDTQERPVTDVLDSVLSCVMMVKTATSVCASRGHKQARLSWISLLTQLGIAVSDDIILLEDTTFLRARTKTKSMVTGIEDVVGRSSLLLATLLNFPVGTNHTNETGMNIDETEPEIRSCNCSTALDIPLDAHILPGCGKRMNCLLPVVCVAPEHEIAALLTTVACQRYVLNITLPVIGVSLPTSGTTAKIILGWAEGKEDGGDDAVPVVHIAYAQGNTIHPSVGVFDLLDPASTLYFAQFILGLEPYFSTIRECDGLQTRKFCWRLDHIGYDHPIQSSSNDPSRISSWIHGLSTEITEPCALGLKINPLTNNMPPKKGTSSTQSKASSSSQFLQVPPPRLLRGRSHSLNRQSTAPSQHAGSSSSSSSNMTENGDSESQPKTLTSLTASYYPASRFAKLAPHTGAVEKWLWERRTIRLFRIELSAANSDLERQINHMIQQYDRITQFSWPGPWISISGVPPRDSVHENIRKRLFDSYQEYKADNSLPVMEEDVFCSINNHVSALYRAVANARASHQQAKVEEAKEAALRSSWDELLKAVCCDVDDASSIYVIAEIPIPLPRNKATQLGSTFGADIQAHLQSELLSSQIPESRKSAPPAIRMALAASYFHAEALNPPTTLKPEDRSYEPATAIVDAICYLRHDIQTHSNITPTTGKGSKRTKHDKSKENPESKNHKARKPVGWMSRFIKMVSPKSAMNEACKGRKPPPTAGNKENKENIKASRHMDCFLCPFVTDTLGLSPSESSSPDFGFVSDTEIHIPYLFTEYKRFPSGEHQAFHQAQMYITFGVEFLAALGITDEPVWALVTSGSRGSIIMAWKSTANSAAVECNFIIDRYIRSFDISQPLEALQLMACLRRIYQRGLSLQATLMQRVAPLVFMNPTAAIQDKMMPPREARPVG